MDTLLQEMSLPLFAFRYPSTLTSLDHFFNRFDREPVEFSSSDLETIVVNYPKLQAVKLPPYFDFDDAAVRALGVFFFVCLKISKR